MTTSDYSKLIHDTAQEAGVRAADLAAAYDLATTLGDANQATAYYNQITGINIVLDIMAEKLQEHDDD